MKSGKETKASRCFPEKHNMSKMYSKCKHDPYIEMEGKKQHTQQYLLPLKLPQHFLLSFKQASEELMSVLFVCAIGHRSIHSFTKSLQA